MKTTRLEKRLRRRLNEVGINLTPGSVADKKVHRSAEFAAELVQSSSSAISAARDALEDINDVVRAAIHRATKPAPKRKR